MSYLHIENLYKNRDILLFKECWSLEKVHGSSAHVSWDTSKPSNDKLSFFSGGAKHEEFLKCFDMETLKQRLCRDFGTTIGTEKDGVDLEMHPTYLTIFGETMGGKMQGMRATYGDKLQFIAFEVRIGTHWLNVPNAEGITKSLGLEFVPYRKIPATVEAIEAELQRDSEVAERRGIRGKKREGVVLRPLIELEKGNGARIIAKHKHEVFRETKKPRNLNAEKLEVLKEAQAVADEWVTEMRLTHVLDKIPYVGLEKMGEIMKAMIEDIRVEAGTEIAEWTHDTNKAINRKTAELMKRRVREGLK